MKFYSFDRSVGKTIEAYNSRNFVMSRILNAEGRFHIGCMHIGADGVVGFHQAPIPQLLLVVSGEGWVRAEDSERISVSAGTAVFWSQGEWHESGSDEGMTAIVIESAELDPAAFMPEKVI